MRYLLLSFLLLMIGSIAKTQNVFPASGNVGIGTTAPVSQLHVAGNITLNSGNKVVYDPVYEIHGYTQYDYSGLPEAAMLRYGYYGHRFETRNGLALVIRGNNNNVGVGTSNPAVKLDVVGGISIQNNNNLTWGGAYGAGIPTIAAVVGTGLYFYPTGSSSGATFTLDNSGASFAGKIMGNNASFSGNVGIGTAAPLSKQHISLNSAGAHPAFSISPTLTLEHAGFDGQLQFLTSSNYASFIMFGDERNYDRGSIVYDHRSESEKLAINVNLVTRMSILANGNVGIGTTSPTDKLSVNGNIRAKKVIAAQTGWSDYVFNDDYKLLSLSEVARFIKDNKHLPEIPSAKEVEEKGIDLGDNQALLLKKIEELTLYMIEMKKQNDKQQRQIEQQATEIRKLKNRSK